MNLSQLQARVLSRGFDSVQYGAKSIDYINNAYLFVCRRVNYYVDETTQTYATSASVADIVLPANWARTRSLLDLDLERELTEVSLRDIDRSSVLSGTPTYYAQDATSLRLYPTPDGVHNLELRYWLLPSPLVNPGDSPSLPTDWHEMLTYGATAMCYWDEDDSAMGQAWDARFDRELAAFTADQRFPSTNVPTQIKSMWGEGLLGSNGWTRGYGGY